MSKGIGAGIPFPDIYDWTWGEVQGYIKARNEAERDTLRTQAMMNFHTCQLLARMVSGRKGERLSVMDAFSFLWTDEERQQAKTDRIKRELMERSAVKPKPMTPEEQSALLKKKEAELGLKR